MSSSEEEVDSSDSSQVFEYGSASGMPFGNISSVVEDINDGNDVVSGELDGNFNDADSEGILCGGFLYCVTVVIYIFYDDCKDEFFGFLNCGFLCVFKLCVDNISQTMEEDADGSKLYTPVVDESLRPKVGDFFETIDVAEKVFRKYAAAAGFDVRLSNKKTNKYGITTARFFVCNKEGNPTPKLYDSLNVKSGERRRRNSNLKRSGCLACMKVHYVKLRQRYEIYKFNEKHNHMLFSEQEMSLSRANRELSFGDQCNVFNACVSKVGISKSHRLRNISKGNAGLSGGTVRDYQNFKRDMVTFVGCKDAKMLINTMVSRQKCNPEFFFEFKCNEKELLAIFWADEIARMNYREFGDVVSFDATYRTQKHAMVFVPFIVVDNHKKSVVVGAALSRSESVVNFTWILKAFVKAHGSQPRLVVTDQCPAMKQAIPIALPNSIHRLCMWHIMKKIKSKVSTYLVKETNFVADIKKLVWNVRLEPEEFEVKWKELIDRYNLGGKKWFKKMFQIRRSWIPAYFKDTPMSGLMRTTSRSESINAFFNVFAAFWDDLVSFLRSFDIAIESQRNSHCIEEVKTKSTVPRMCSPSKLEIHASTVYTRKIFFEVQKELIKAVWFCGWDGISKVDGKHIYVVTHKNKSSEVVAKYTVVQDKSEMTVDCSCNLFVRMGILCRHALKVLLNDDLDCIPDKYILRRWRCDLIPPQWLPARVRYGEVDIEKERLMAKAFVIIDRMIGRVRNEKELLQNVVEKLNVMDEELEAVVPLKPRHERRKEVIQELVGVHKSDAFDILPPSGISNKGSGKGKRLKSVREREGEKAKKAKRLCRTCNDKVRHDSRNCPMRGM
ncbi:hypothetical protein OSB04_001417 [Centaurea solstitialis]|uniref:SWIM-type domain-containing protein n=1 Tax=Centaurea solstitialis TaxID=347529 RepID=A0AA38U1I5_9ASTR|nr:hypothetical protein OSB04_001417 [Centaurea solstitialis]